LEEGGYCGEDAYTASWSQLVSPVAEPSVDLRASKMLHIELAHSEFFSHLVPIGPGQTQHIALNRAIQIVSLN